MARVNVFLQYRDSGPPPPPVVGHPGEPPVSLGVMFMLDPKGTMASRTVSRYVSISVYAGY